MSAEVLGRLRETLADHDRAVVTFSGGVDSGLLAFVATETLGPERVLCATAVSPSLAGADRDACRDLAADWGLRWREVTTEEMARRDVLDSPRAVRDWLRLKLAQLPHEVFMILLLDAQNRIMGNVELFRGTLTQTSVYPREVVKLVLEHNAAAVILAHNHPSGVGEPSIADQSLTKNLIQALALIDVRVLDHFIVAGNAPPVSFAERGLL